MTTHTPWAVIASPTDNEMSAVKGVYLVADRLPIEDAWLIAAAPKLLAVAYAELNAVEQDIQWAEASQLEALIERRDRLEAVIASATGAA